MFFITKSVIKKICINCIIFLISALSVFPCSIFTASGGDNIIFANDEGGGDMSSFLCIQPPDADKYGVIYFTLEYLDHGIPIRLGGVNEYGLCADECGVARHEIANDPNNPTFYDISAMKFQEYALDYCKDVDDVRYALENYHFPGELEGQVHIADAKGNKIVVSSIPYIGTGGQTLYKMGITEVNPGYTKPTDPEEASFLFTTNTNIANPSEFDPTCERYQVFNTELPATFKTAADVTLANAEKVFRTLCSEDPFSLYQFIVDPKSKMMNIYFYHQFDDPYSVNINELINSVNKTTYIPMYTLFKRETVENAIALARAHNEDPNKGRIVDIDYFYDNFFSPTPTPTPTPTPSILYTKEAGIIGTSIEHLKSFKGKLYAGNSIVKESLSGSCEILVKSSADNPWTVLTQEVFTNDKDVEIGSMQFVTFTTDKTGTPIAPVTILLASPQNLDKEASLYILNLDGELLNKITFETDSSDEALSNYCNQITFHTDSTSKADMVFISTANGGKIFSGVYDSTKPGLIDWGTMTPEATVSIIDERIQGFTECNGILYGALKNYLYRRNDGNTTKLWERVYTYHYIHDQNYTGIEGLSTVPNPNGEGEVLIFYAAGKFWRMDPNDNFSYKLEVPMSYKILEYFPDVQPGFVHAAPTGFVPYQLPDSQATTWICGIKMHYSPYQIKTNTSNDIFLLSEENEPYIAAEGYFVTRNKKGDYKLFQIHDKTIIPKEKLGFTKTMAVSPFPEDEGRVVYFGGNPRQGYKQIPGTGAWIYKAQMFPVE